MVLRGFCRLIAILARSMNGYFKMTSFRFLMAILICIAVRVHRRIYKTFSNGVESDRTTDGDVYWTLESKLNQKKIAMNISMAVKHSCWVQPVVSGWQKSNRRNSKLNSLLIGSHTVLEIELQFVGFENKCTRLFVFFLIRSTVACVFNVNFILCCAYMCHTAIGRRVDSFIICSILRTIKKIFRAPLVPHCRNAWIPTQISCPIYWQMQSIFFYWFALLFHFLLITISLIWRNGRNISLWILSFHLFLVKRLQRLFFGQYILSEKREREREKAEESGELGWVLNGQWPHLLQMLKFS